MKKAFLVLLVFVSFFLGNCLGSPGIKFDTLETKKFTLKWVIYMTNMNEFNQDIPIVFDSLPINEVVKQAESKYGINIDATLFDDVEMNRSNIKSAVLGNMANHEIDYESSENQLVGIIFGKYHQQDELQADISIFIEDNGKTIGQTKMSIKIPDWDPYKN